MGVKLERSIGGMGGTAGSRIAAAYRRAVAPAFTVAIANNPARVYP
jgi:hypothetical protein